MFLLHVHGTGAGGAPEFFEEVFYHGFTDTLTLIPFLFLTYLLMEYIEHKAKHKAERFMEKAGGLAPVVGGVAGALPQCGFSAAAANLYSARIISFGTLIAVFLSTSDEMLPILISGNIGWKPILIIMAYKTLAATLAGLIINLIVRHVPSHGEAEDLPKHEHECECHGGILRSAIYHTLKISLFVLIVNLSVNTLIFLVGEDTLGTLLYDMPLVGHLISAVFGLIPNCAVSVVLATLASDGIITAGMMLSGLFSGAGIGLAVLLKQNRSKKENALALLCLVLCGFVFGYLADVIMPDLLLSV